MTRPRQRGFALMMAIFILVTLAGIGLYLLTVSVSQQEAQSQDERGALAYQAARTGLDWGAYQLLRNAANPFATACAAGVPAAQALNLTGELDAYMANVSCSRAGTHSEAGQTVEVFHILSTGCSDPCGALGPTYVERQLELTLAR